MRAGSGLVVLALLDCSAERPASGEAADASGDRSEPPVIESIEIAPSTLRMLPGESRQLIATMRDPRERPLAGLSVAWSSSDTTKAKVSTSGVVRAIAPGAVEIVASSRGERGVVETSIGAAPKLRYASVAAGGGHSCGLIDEGTAYCWGADGAGQLGTGSVLDTPRGTSDPAAWSRLRPTRVAGNLAFASLAASEQNTCGITIAGEAYCWGSDLFGQLGSRDSTTVDERRRAPHPVRLEGTPPLVQIEPGGWHTCGLAASGRAYCWGGADTIPVPPVLGRRGRRNSPVPLPVEGSVLFRSITAGPFHTCGVTDSGEAFCWGDAENIGAGVSDAVLPVRVAEGVTWKILEAGMDHTCGLTAEGLAYCWGRNESGQLGNGTRTNSSRPVPVAGGLKFALIDADWSYTCGLTTGGVVYCWGANESGELGIGTRTPSLLPVPIAGSLEFTDMAIAGGHGCAVTSEGAAYCWGSNDVGELGTGRRSEQQSRPSGAGASWWSQRIETIPVRVADPQ